MTCIVKREGLADRGGAVWKELSNYNLYYVASETCSPIVLGSRTVYIVVKVICLTNLLVVTVYCKYILYVYIYNYNT